LHRLTHFKPYVHKHHPQQFCLSAAFFQFGYTVPFVHLSPYIQDLGISPTFAGLCVGLIGAGSALGRVTLGWVADRFGRVGVFRVTLVGSGVTCAVWLACTTEAPLVLFSLFFGYFNGGFLAMFPVIISMYFGVARLGGISGIFNMANIPGALSGAPLAGYVKDSTGSYTIAIIASAVFILLSALTMYTVGPPPDEEPGKEARVQSTNQLTSQASDSAQADAIEQGLASRGSSSKASKASNL
jgi:MFS family permease